MLKFLCLVVLTAGALATQVDEEYFLKSISRIDERIIGGANAARAQFRHQVSLRHNNGRSHFCGGSIIARRFVLTAAHCTQRQLAQPDNVRVVVGATLVSTGGTQYRTDRIINHPNYNNRTLANDIAVIRTAEPIVFNALVQPISLPRNDVPVAGGVASTLSGWGQFRVSFFLLIFISFQF